MSKKILAIIAVFLFIFSINVVIADELDDINKELDSLSKALSESQKATKPLESDLAKLKSQFAVVQKKILVIEIDLNNKEKQQNKAEKNFVIQKGILDKRVAEHYKNIKRSSVSIINLLVADNLPLSIQQYFYQKKVTDNDKQTILRIVFQIKALEEAKKQLNNDKIKLTEAKKKIDSQSTFLAQEIGKAKTYQSQLSSKIAQLSAKQQQLIAQKLAGLNIPRSAGTSMGGCRDDRDVDPGFSPRIAFYTYGVPNRVGLNQYGAKGRAEAGQNEEQILRAYYDNFELKKDYSADININVDGHGTFNIEDYVKRIYEMPESWNIAALKAQAIAARSYALAYTNNGAGSICTTQQCQVFKPDPKGGAWEQAVNETRGWVMVSGGNPVKAWYSSTHGGFVLKTGEIGWSDTSWTKHSADTTNGSIGSFSDLQNNAYDKSSPWFYCDWGSRSQYNKTAWLKADEVADIVNVILLAQKDSSTIEHLYQPDKSNPAGTDTWDANRVKTELKNRGGNPFNNISGVSVSADFSGYRTTNVSLSGDAGSASFDGREFKDWFNLRAPANIQIVGQLYNVEKR